MNVHYHVVDSRGRDLGTVSALPSLAFRANHVVSGQMVEPDWSAVPPILPRRWQKAWERRGPAWFPLTLVTPATCITNAATVELFNSRGKHITSLYFTPTETVQ